MVGIVDGASRAGFFDLGRDLVHRSHLDRLIDHGPLASFRRRLIGMSSADVVLVADTLSRAGVPMWLAGGWGIDTLLGRRTRPHTDLDLLVDHRHAYDAVRALQSLGFVVTQAQAVGADVLPSVTVLRRANGHAIDVLWIAAVANDGEPGVGLPVFPPEAFTRGVLEGRVLPCLSAAEQWRLHTGYDLDRVHRRDLRRLRRTYGPPPGVPSDARMRAQRAAALRGAGDRDIDEV